MEYCINESQLIEIGKWIRTTKKHDFSKIINIIRKNRYVEPNYVSVSPKNIVYFTDFIVMELKELLDHTDMNNLLRSASYLRESRRSLFYWKLNPIHSYKYYNSTADMRGSYNYEYNGEKNLFATVLNSRLRDTRTQLSLTLTMAPKDKGDRNIRKRRDNIINIKYLENLHALTLDGVAIVGDLSHLTTLSEFSVSFKYEHREITDKFEKSLDMAHFKNCAFMRICGSYEFNISNINLHYLQNCRTLWLERVSIINITHISCLPKLKKLLFHDCHGFDDYSLLNKNISLYLSGVLVCEHRIPKIGAFRELYFSVGSADMIGLKSLLTVKSLYLMPKRGNLSLVRDFCKVYPNTKTWEDDGTWSHRMYF